MPENHAPQVESLALPTPYRRYVELRGGYGQLVAFIATAAGLKPVLDDWIRVERLDAFTALLDELGLHHRVESVFEFLDTPDAALGVAGGDKLNTTRAAGRDPSSRAPGGAAHVFMARDRAWLDRAVVNGWYNLVVDRRVVSKPWIDHHHFGECLGYPDCCRRAFASFNDWGRDNTLYQSFRASRAPNFLCNTLWKNTGFSYAVHLPCAFDCAETAARAVDVRAAVERLSPATARFADALLRRPCLVLSEWEAFGFVGRMAGPSRVEYGDVIVMPTNRPDAELHRRLLEGDAAELENGVVRIYREGRAVSTASAAVDRFGPQAPFLVDFAG